MLSDDIAGTKNELRRILRAARRQISSEIAQAASASIVTHFQNIPRWRDYSIVAGYFPQGAELDLLPLLAMIDAAGVALALPAIEADGAMIFRRWRPGDAMRRVNNIDQPLKNAPLVQPDLVLVPLLGFDRNGNRLGSGAGYYDRALAKLRHAGSVTAIGIAYAVQEVASLPTAPHDQYLDGILTETEMIWVR